MSRSETVTASDLDFLYVLYHIFQHMFSPGSSFFSKKPVSFEEYWSYIYQEIPIANKMNLLDSNRIFFLYWFI